MNLQLRDVFVKNKKYKPRCSVLYSNCIKCFSFSFSFTLIIWLNISKVIFTRGEEEKNRFVSCNPTFLVAYTWSCYINCTTVVPTYYYALGDIKFNKTEPIQHSRDGLPFNIAEKKNRNSTNWFLRVCVYVWPLCII